MALFMYIGSFSLGLSTLTFVIPAEIFPLRYRAKGFGLSWAVNRTVSGLTSSSYPVLSAEYGAPIVFLGYSLIALAGLLFVFYKLPEVL